MKTQNIILTSMLALVIASPAMAAVGDTVNAENPAMCTIGDLGVSSGTANATAQFRVNTYNCAAGQYLPADAIACTTCPPNSYCEGDTFSYDASNAQGAVTCASKWGDGYPYSDAGSDNSDACYFVAPCPTISAATACDPHADTCAYTNDAITTNGRIYAEGEPGPNMPKCSLDFTCAEGYTKSTSQTAPTLPSTDGDSYEYHSHDNNDISTNGSSLSSGEWSTTWNGTGTMKGIASCNTVPGNNDEWTWANGGTLPANTNLASTSTTGRYCWCKPTSWTPSGGSEQLLSAAWVFYGDHGDASHCANYCANGCAYNVNDSADFRSALFGQIGASPQCVANTIDINWKNENGTVFTTDQCTYDESLTVPSTHPDKRGYTFTGWKFVSPSQN